MKPFFRTFFSLVLLALAPVLAGAQVTVRMSDEPVDVARWIETRFAKGQIPPFSFVYGGKHSSTLLPRWSYSSTKLESDDPDRIEYLYTYTDRSTGLKVECRVKGYPSFHAVEWVLNFTQTGKKDTPILEDVRVADFRMTYPHSGEVIVHHAEGNHITKNDFAPHSTPLVAGETFAMEPEGGRSSQGQFLPFFNIQTPGGQGVVVAVGWTGTWFADIDKVGDRGFALRSGMKTMRLYLHPDESIRTPSIGLLFWQGDDRMVGNNAFRRFVRVHQARKVDGKAATYPLSFSFNYRDPAPCTEYSCITADWAIAMVNRYKRFELVPDVFWLDAGWTTGAADYRNGKSWANTNGNWTIDTTRFPEGLKPVADAVHKAGAKFMVWFEPERVVKGTQWAVDYPQWMLDKELPATDKSESRDWLLFDMGNTEAREWLQEYIGDMIEQNGIDYYRQDFNMEPDQYWARYDEPDRIGMKEIRHIEGLYAFWDYLLERFPGLLIDNCASGGRRLDLETIKRSAPLWRSDYYHYDDPDGYQCHNFGLSFFLPFHGTGILQTDPYSFRSSMSSALICNWKITEPGVSFLDMQARIDEYRRVRDYFLEDYYPLTELEGTTRDDIWLAYQYDRPSDGTGIVVAFRRAACPDPALTVRLSGIDASRNYSVYNFDTGESVTVPGAELASGYVLTLPEPRGSMLLQYKLAE